MSPVSSAAALGWMREHGDELRGLLAEEGAGADPGNVSDDPAIRAHLRFMVAAMAATAEGPVAGDLAGFRDALPAWLAEGDDLLEQHLEIARGAMALEQHLQFGTRPGTDPSLDAALEQRARIGGWIRIVLLGLERHLGPGGDGLEAQAMSWLGARDRDLGRLRLALRMQAEQAARARVAGEVDIDTRDAIGQLAALQAYVRMTAEAIEASLPSG